MPIIRNPFRKQDENVRPSITTGVEQKPSDVTAIKPVDVATGKEKDSAEYKLSEINDSGVYLPPSPTGERKSFWSTHSSRSTTSTSNNYRAHLNASDDQFSISRESFDSYRRSFDISARSPVLQGLQDAGAGRTRASLDPGRTRASLDSRTFMPPPPPPRSSNSFTRPSQVPAQLQEEPTQPDSFEDVDIQDKPTAQQPKKRGLFSRITEFNDHSERPSSQDGKDANKSEKPWHHFGGRKRGQSGQGAELGAIPKRETTPKPESALKNQASAHGRHGSITSFKPVKEAPKIETPKVAETPKIVETQAMAGAAKPEEELRADSGIDVEHAAQEMKEVSLDDTPKPEVSKTSIPTPKNAEEQVKVPEPVQNAQVPEMKTVSLE
ncbi:hypothetical protein LTR15_008614 [Elasticomyces elasticus]|nr:hypothetical protein LTR15_008614 [Elasticomyces elasticus]